MATKTRRFEFRAEDRFVEELERLATASGTTKAQVIDRAIGLYAEALRQAEEGKSIYFMAEDEAKHLAHAQQNSFAVIQIYGQLRTKRYKELGDAEIRRISAGVEQQGTDLGRISAGVNSIGSDLGRLAAYITAEEEEESGS